MKDLNVKKPAVDRRIQKTKKSLSEALIMLILEKGYEKVTIQDIIDKANAGRSTFYAHYESKEQLLLDGHNNLGVSLFDEDSNMNFLSLFKHVGENIQLAKAMLGKKSGGVIFGYFKSHIAQKINEQYKEQFLKTKADKVLLQYYSDAAASVVISFLVSWLDDDMPFSDINMAERCQQAVNAIFEVKSKKELHRFLL